MISPPTTSYYFVVWLPLCICINFCQTLFNSLNFGIIQFPLRWIHRYCITSHVNFCLHYCRMYVFENVLYVSTHCIFWIFEKHSVREYLPYSSKKRKSLKSGKSFVRRISQENIQSKILHLSSHFCSQLSSTNVLHKSFESCIFAWVCLHRNYILLQLLEVCSFFYGQNFSHLLQK